jgi:Spy/CpxP family protein refolding chaperone
MKSMIMAVVGAVLLSSAAVAMAQDATSRPTSRLGHGDRGAMLENAIKELNLTPEVAQKVRDIFKTQGEAMQAFREANGEKVRDLETQLRAARQANDDTKVADLQKQLETLRAPVKEAQETAQKALAAVLTPEQLEKLRQLMPPPGGPRERIQRLEERLGLTDAQKAQAKTIIDDAAATADKATDPKDKAAAWEAAFQKFVKDVLTDDQRAKLKDMGPGHDGAGATSRPHRHNGGNPPPPPPADGATPPPPPAGGANPPPPPPAG